MARNFCHTCGKTLSVPSGIAPREITIECPSEIYVRKYGACEGCNRYLTDSEILHDMLTFIDPGDNYSVKFENAMCQKNFHGIQCEGILDHSEDHIATLFGTRFYFEDNNTISILLRRVL